MIKSKSVSTGITRPTSTERQHSPMLKFNPKKTDGFQMLHNPFPNQYPLKFPKKLMHTPTAMNMLIETQESNKRMCLRANPNAHKATMLEPSTPRRQLKSGDYSHLAYQSPSKTIRERDFEDFGAQSNRKRTNQHKYNSISVLASINENVTNVSSDKFTRAVEKKHFQATCEMKKQMQWKQDKPNKSYFQKKYQKHTKQIIKQKNNPESSYSSIHLKYTTYK